MRSDELPVDFRFERYIDGPGLYYRDHVVATASPANCRPSPPYRIAINPNSIHRRYEFTDTETQAVRYMAAWARKWEKRIIAEVISLNPPKSASKKLKSLIHGQPIHVGTRAEHRGSSDDSEASVGLT